MGSRHLSAEAAVPAPNRFPCGRSGYARPTLSRLLLLQRSLPDGYTNGRQLMGSWVGRQGSGFQLWSTYWFSGRTTVQANYRSMWVDHSFLQGGWLQDVGLTTNVALGPDFSLQAGAVRALAISLAGSRPSLERDDGSPAFVYAGVGVALMTALNDTALKAQEEMAKSPLLDTTQAGSRIPRCCGTVAESWRRWLYVRCC